MIIQQKWQDLMMSITITRTYHSTKLYKWCFMFCLKINMCILSISCHVSWIFQHCWLARIILRNFLSHHDSWTWISICCKFKSKWMVINARQLRWRWILMNMIFICFNESNESLETPNTHIKNQKYVLKDTSRG